MAHLLHRKDHKDHADRTHHADHTDHANHTDTPGGAHSAPGAHAERHVVDGEVHEDHARDRFGGVNIGAAFFGWLVAIALTVLLSSIIGAIASGVGESTNFTQDQAQREAGAIGLAAAIALVVVMAVAYYGGGYVAGRMSRFDGARQGVAVWLIGLIVTIVAVVLGVAFGNEYNVLDRVDLPRVPIPTEAATWGGIITGVALLLGSLLAAVAGGRVGHRYHDRVDRAAFR